MTRQIKSHKGGRTVRRPAVMTPATAEKLNAILEVRKMSFGDWIEYHATNDWGAPGADAAKGLRDALVGVLLFGLKNESIGLSDEVFRELLAKAGPEFQRALSSIDAYDAVNHT